MTNIREYQCSAFVAPLIHYGLEETHSGKRTNSDRMHVLYGEMISVFTGDVRTYHIRRATERVQDPMYFVSVVSAHGVVIDSAQNIDLLTYLVRMVSSITTGLCCSHKMRQCLGWYVKPRIRGT